MLTNGSGLISILFRSTRGWIVAILLGHIAALAGELSYNRDIRPILSENCFACHGPDSAARKGNLRLDHFSDAVAPRKDGKLAIVPGKPEQSEVIHRVFTTDEDDVMPPLKSRKVLKQTEKETLRKWIAEGAKYEAHWSLIAPVRPKLPVVAKKESIRNPIDHFVLAKLEQMHLAPEPEADKRTLARRVTLDITGLPPTPGEVERFVKDQSPKAYENFVDRLLASEHWGEHRARYWLDVARYADTHGLHFDNFRENWAYRDWVIQAFNRNMPFDQFTIEQLAGDLLPNATLEQKIATGFNRCNITTSEGGSIDEEYLVLYTRDRTETTSQAWLGLTAGCAVCHDHKYDPLSQKEFYQLSAFFNNTTQKAMDGNVKDTPPAIVVTRYQDRARWAELQNETNVAGMKLAERKRAATNDFKSWQVNPTVTSQRFLPADAPVFQAFLADGEQKLTAQIKGKEESIELSTAAWQAGVISAKAFSISSTNSPAFPGAGELDPGRPFSYSAWIRIPKPQSGTVFGKMADQDGKLRGWDFALSDGLPTIHMSHEWPSEAIKIFARNPITTNRWTHLCVTYAGSGTAEGFKIYLNAELQPLYLDSGKDTVSGSIATTVPFRIGRRETGSVLQSAGLQDLRIYDRILDPVEIAQIMKVPRLQWLAEKRSEDRGETEEFFNLWLEQEDAAYRAAWSDFTKLRAEQDAIRSRGTIAHVMEERSSDPEAYLLFRGEYDKRRDRVTPSTPSALPALGDLPGNRLGLARWLVRPENPLTARVIVNRFWQEIFGTGLVKTAGDFGVAGELPSNPELLDWLAVEFRESGWDVNRFFKLIVMSSTYRQVASVSQEKLAKDPENRFLSRGPHFRMDAEMIRDYALAASGLMVKKVGGASVKPYQPDGIWKAVAIPLSDTSKYIRDSGENLYRRSLYTFWKRSAPPPQMEIFNAPNRETCTVRRERTNTPLQALAALNDEQLIEAARHLAQETLLEASAKESDRIDFMFQRLLGRLPTSREKAIVEGSVKYMLSHYEQEPADAQKLVRIGDSGRPPSLPPTTLAAYTMVANQLMNLDEVLTK